MYTTFYKKYIPKKKLGQHFLHNKNIIKKIINFINPKINDCLVEIGPGLAALTHPILSFVNNLSVIEIDQRFLFFLKKCSFYHKLDIFNENAITFDFKKISIKNNKSLRIFGNIPYNISTQLILYLIKFRKYIYDINFMIQKEVAQRLLALPNTKYYGRLSIIIQCYYDVFFGFNILPNSFFPIPKIDSTFIHIKPKKIPLFPYNKINFLSEITFLAFMKRRKILKNSLSNILNKKDFLNLNINSNIRAENLSVIEYCKLADFLFFMQNKY